MGTIADKLNYLNATKVMLRDALMSSGARLTNASPFRDYAAAIPFAQRTLDLDFARNTYKVMSGPTLVSKNFTDLITFTRASGGGRFNHLGQYEWLAANDTPRFGFDPATVSASTSSVAIGAGQLTFAVTRQYALGEIVRATADASNYLVGKVIAATASSVTLLVDSDGFTGSGTFSSWTLIVSRGLLIEEQRTNLLTYSSMFDNSAWNKTNTTVSPVAIIDVAGGNSAYVVRETTANSIHSIKQYITGAASSPFSSAVFIKSAGRTVFHLLSHNGTRYTGKRFDLATGTAMACAVPGVSEATRFGIVRLPNDWFFCWVVNDLLDSTTTWQGQIRFYSGSDSYPGDGTSGFYLWGSQIESAVSPSLYIPTASAQVTRAVDQAYVNSVAAWLNTTQFTLSAEFASRSVASATPSSICGLNDGTANNRANLRVVSGQAVQTVTSGGADVVSAQLGAVSADVKYKVAAAFKADDYAGSLAGAAPVADTAGALPSVTTLSLGGFGTAEALNGHLGAVRCVPRRITNAELQAVSA